MAYSGVGMYVGTDSLGGHQVDSKLTALAFRTPQPMSVLRSFLDIRVNLGKNEGDTVFRNKWSDISTAGGSVAESSTIATDRYYTLTQATATVTEFGNSVSAKSKLVDLANITVDSEIIVGLRNDEVKTIDKYLYTNVYNACLGRYVGTATNGYALTTDGTATATCTSVLNAYHIRKMRKTLESLNVPKFANGNYVLICSLNAAENLYDDADWKNAQYYGKAAGGVLTGYMGTLYGVDILRENTSLTDQFTNYTSSGEAFMLGMGYGTEDLVAPAEVRTNIAIAKMMGKATDFGRYLEFAWYEMSAFGVLWNAATQYHCIKWDSA